jgi:hypothetical protein
MSHQNPVADHSVYTLATMSVAVNDTDMSDVVTLEDAREGLQKVIAYLQRSCTLSDKYVQVLLEVLHHLHEVSVPGVNAMTGEPIDTVGEDRKDIQANEGETPTM